MQVKFFLLNTLVLLSLIACDDGNQIDYANGADRIANSSISEIDGTKRPKNIILMINDGASWNTWELASRWQEGVRTNASLAYSTMPVRLGMTTYPLNNSTIPTYNDRLETAYDPLAAWDTTKVEADHDVYQRTFAAYQYLMQNWTDSAAAGTALATGQKTYNSAINYDNNGLPLRYITQLAKQQGKATGVVTTVQFSHATPAVFSAQNSSRSNMIDIARDQLTNGVLDLLIGTGHPEYDDNGQLITHLHAEECQKNMACLNPYNTIGEEEWYLLKNQLLYSQGKNMPWTLIESKADFEQLASAPMTLENPVLGIPQIRLTLQQRRDQAVVGHDKNQPSQVKKIESVPDLALMTKGALQYLAQGENGFFLVIEGGATDWAAHANQTDRLIEETIDFNQALIEVQDWVEANSSWSDTLLIVTTDHGNSLPLGDKAQHEAFNQITFSDTQVLPNVSYWSSTHTNELVRLWAKGQGSEAFLTMIRGHDEKFSEIVQHNDGSFIDITDVFNVMRMNILPTN